MTTELNAAVRDPRRVRLFWDKVRVAGADDCWVWTASTNGVYGRLYIGSRNVAAHRFSLVLHTGAVLSPDDVVMHSCDNPPCVNPAHLSVGTQLDNVADRRAKGRCGGGRLSQPGAMNPNARLSLADVAEIRRRRALGESTRALSRAFGVSPSHISRISTGFSWRER